MNVSSHRLRRLVAALALLSAIAASLAPVAPADDWARDRAASAAYYQLDPAIRAAIESRAAVAEPASLEPTRVTPVLTSEGFAWGAAALGLLVGVGAMCVAFACVTLVRHDGRLRSA